MSVPARLIGFALVLGIAFGGAALAGAAFGPDVEAAPEHGSEGHGAPAAHPVRGLAGQPGPGYPAHG